MQQKWQLSLPLFLAHQDFNSTQAGEFMYNRYVPQPDGSFQRNRVQDRAVQNQHRAQPAVRSEQVSATFETEPHCKQENHPNHKIPASRKGGSIIGFIRQILPKGLDTGDLLIILLLLLIAGDCDEDQNTAMLTLALYLFM